jgi:hypothetical protein
MLTLQRFIHQLEVGGGMRYFRWGLGGLVLLLFLIGYNMRAFKNMSTQEAMDSAQLARNIAEGKGYTTLFVRPFSMYLVKRHALQKKDADPRNLCQLKGNHPDLANPPVYPFVLAGLMKVFNFNYSTSVTKPFWTNNGGFWRYQPDFIISAFNQLLFLGCVGLTFILARRLFGRSVASIAALLTLGTELFWRFCVSGLSTILLLLIFLCLLWCLSVLEQEVREPQRGPFWRMMLALLVGILTGLGGLTRYSFAWLILPVLLFLILFAGQRRVLLAVVAFVAFSGVMTPWVVRNYSVSGTPFGVPGYCLAQNGGSTGPGEHRFERSLEPKIPALSLHMVFYKLFANARQLLTNDLPKLGGNWLTAFFLVGLLVGFRNPAAKRLRYFVVASLVVLAIVQALGRTELSDDSPELNSENLLVLLAPIVLVYGSSLFFLLLEQIELPFTQLRYGAIGLLAFLVSLPLILVFLPPRGWPIAFPPYWPPVLQAIANWTKDDELTMSDVPWALAWYGKRQCAWLTLNPREDFLAINDYQKPVQALCVSRLALDNRAASDWLPFRPTWGSFILDSMSRGIQVAQFKHESVKPVPPKEFPLHVGQEGWPDHFLVTARDKWLKDGP